MANGPLCVERCLIIAWVTGRVMVNEKVRVKGKSSGRKKMDIKREEDGYEIKIKNSLEGKSMASPATPREGYRESIGERRGKAFTIPVGRTHGGERRKTLRGKRQSRRTG